MLALLGAEDKFIRPLGQTIEESGLTYVLVAVDGREIDLALQMH
jgi:hypothetical protein